MTDSICWTCSNCCSDCEWVEHGILPKGVITENTGTKSSPNKIVRCPDYQKAAVKIEKDSRFCREGYENLQEAIVKDAINEYKTALFVLKIFDDVGSLKVARAKITKRECERFFASQWFCALCDINGKALSKQIRKYVNEEWQNVVDYIKGNNKFPKGTGMPSIITRNRKTIERRLLSGL